MAAIRPSSDQEHEYLCGDHLLDQKLDEGLAAMQSGNVRPAEDVFADLEARFGFPGA